MNLRLILKKIMDRRNEKSEQQEEQPGSMSSYNQRQEGEEGRVEQVSDGKDEGQSYVNYNGNSEENAPARAKED